MGRGWVRMPQISSFVVPAGLDRRPLSTDFKMGSGPPLAVATDTKEDLHERRRLPI